MALLSEKDYAGTSPGELQFQLTLEPAPGDKNWMCYVMEIQTIQEKTLINLSRENLYLMFFPENEIHELCAGLSRIAKREQENFSFTPLDEKDFIIEVYGRDGKADISVWLSSPMVNDENWPGWGYIGSRMTVTLEALRSFAQDLRAEFRQLREGNDAA